MEKDIRLIEEIKKEYSTMDSLGEYVQALENLLTRYKQLDSLIGEIDNKEVNDALHMLLHCALKNTEYETQKQQFQIVNAYIKQLEEENKNCKKEYHSLINKIENKIDKFDYEFEKAKRKNDKDRADYYWDLIRNFIKLLREE